MAEDHLKEQFEAICDVLSDKEDQVYVGKMMSSPGLKFRDKVFAFYHDGKMVFKLGKSFDPVGFGIDNYSLLSPFKNKPPLAGWFEISADDAEYWEELAFLALVEIRKSFGDS